MIIKAAKHKNKPAARHKILLAKEEWKRYKKWKRDIEVGDYRPFLETHQLHSTGRKHKFFCKRQQRLVHLMSDSEFKAYNTLIWQPNVVAIQEQYALNIHETFAISKHLKIHHPYEYERNIHHIMTTDLVVHYKLHGGIVKKAHSVKYNYQPENQHRARNKFSIEERYWNNRDIPLSPLSSVNINKDVVKNYQFLGLHYDLNISDELLACFRDKFCLVWNNSPKSPLRLLISAVASLAGLTRFDAEKVFKNAVLRGFINVHSPVLIAFHKPLVLV